MDSNNNMQLRHFPDPQANVQPSSFGVSVKLISIYCTVHTTCTPSNGLIKVVNQYYISFHLHKTISLYCTNKLI